MLWNPPKKQKYSDKMSRAFPYETVYKVTLDNFILIARLRQNANFSSLVCSSALFCLFHVGEKITNYVPADYRSFSLFEFLEFQAQNFKSHLLSTFHCWKFTEDLEAFDKEVQIVYRLFLANCYLLLIELAWTGLKVHSGDYK